MEGTDDLVTHLQQAHAIVETMQWMPEEAFADLKNKDTLFHGLDAALDLLKR